MSIGAVLPLKVSGSYGGDDLNRAHILFASLTRFAEPGLFDDLWVVVPAAEVAQVEAAFARWRSLNIRVLSENALVPGLAAYPKMRGWRKQQIVKLAAATRMRSPFYLTLDADVICLKPLNRDKLIVDGRALMQYEPRSQHPKWWKSSARILRMSPMVGDPSVGATVTPALLARDLCLALMQELQKVTGAASWVDALCQLHLPWNPRNWWPGRVLKLKWTEYSLYYLCAHKLGLLDRYHVTAGTTELPQRLLVHESHPFETWDTAYSFSDRCPGLFCVVGSKSGLPPQAVWDRVGRYIGIVPPFTAAASAAGAQFASQK
jgi:hypothetical protein